MRKARQILCPFCKEQVRLPRRVMAVFTPDGCLTEACACGAVYAVDETGRLGGQALLDAQAVLCEGDLQQAMSLETGKDVDVKSRRFGTQKIRGGGSRFNRTSASARAWFVRRKPA
jgi:hypothetical protein